MLHEATFLLIVHAVYVFMVIKNGMREKERNRQEDCLQDFVEAHLIQLCAIPYLEEITNRTSVFLQQEPLSAYRHGCHYWRIEGSQGVRQIDLKQLVEGIRKFEMSDYYLRQVKGRLNIYSGL